MSRELWEDLSLVVEFHYPILLDKLVGGQLPRQKTARENIIILLLGPVWVQLHMSARYS